MMMTVVRGGAGKPSARAGGTFTGEVWRDEVTRPGNGVSVGNNFFAPGARTYWHTHKGGQLLIVVAGEGIVGDADGLTVVTAGDTIWTPPDVLHWHGASPQRYLLHTAVTLGGAEWHEPVSDAEYPL
jgi:quercetin dioxygenase-like cupin family protein